MSQDIVSARYAKALLEIGVEQKILNTIQKDLDVVYEVMTTSPQLMEWSLHPTTGMEAKKKLFSEIFKDISTVTLHFLFVVIDHHRENLLEETIAQFNHLVHEKKGIAEANITSALPLDEADKEQLTRTFQIISGKSIILKESTVDSDLLGGVVVQIGDRIFDGSLKNKLRRFKERVKKASVGS